MKSRANWRFWHRKGENRQNEGAKGPHPEPEFITIVSGLPRSGTSMLMRMLEAGGMKILADGLREADENNPNGYFELESVKKLIEGDYSWIDGLVERW